MMLESSRTLLYSGLGGLLIGSIASLVVGIYRKQDMLFGLPMHQVITDGIVLLLAGCIVFMSVVSGLMRDLAYPTAAPWKFTVETLLMAFMPAVVFPVMTVLRGYPLTAARWGEFFVLVVKFGLLHILLQFSGFYSAVFPFKTA